METTRAKRIMKKYVSKFTNKSLQHALERIQDVVYWTEWVNQLGKVGEMGLIQWKSIKKDIIDYLVNLQSSLQVIKYDNFSESEFHMMLKMLLKKIKKQIIVCY